MSANTAIFYAGFTASRLIVPKATPWMGLTLNFGHPGIWRALVAIALLPLVILLAQRAYS